MKEVSEVQKNPMWVAGKLIFPEPLGYRKDGRPIYPIAGGAVYDPTGSNNVHIDQVLTNISVGWSNEGLVAEQLFPTVTVRKQADKYYTFGREAWLPESGDFRAPGAEANEIPGMGVSLDTYYAQEHALQIAVTDEERENADSPMSPDRDGTELVTSKILLGRELAMKTLVTDASQYASDMTVDLSVGSNTQWDEASGHPIVDSKLAKHNMHAHIHLDPTVAIFPYQVMSVLEDHADIIERIKYSERAVLTGEIIAQVLGLPRVIVPGTGIATTAALTPSYLWGKDVIFAYVPPRAGLRIPAFAYEFVWAQGGSAQVVDRWRENRRKSDVIRCSRRYDLKLVGRENNPNDANFGKVVSGYLIKNAVS
jgi:hypothetical protein